MAAKLKVGTRVIIPASMWLGELTPQRCGVIMGYAKGVSQSFGDRCVWVRDDDGSESLLFERALKPIGDHHA